MTILSLMNYLQAFTQLKTFRTMPVEEVKKPFKLTILKLGRKPKFSLMDVCHGS